MSFNEESFLQKKMDKIKGMELQVEINAHVTRREATYTVILWDSSQNQEVKKARKYGDFVQLHKMVGGLSRFSMHSLWSVMVAPLWEICRISDRFRCSRVRHTTTL